MGNVGLMFDAAGGVESEHFWLWFELVHGAPAVAAPGLASSLIWELYAAAFETHALTGAGFCRTSWDTEGLLTVSCCGDGFEVTQRKLRRWPDWSHDE